jgi:hypothetical protein
MFADDKLSGAAMPVNIPPGFISLRLSALASAAALDYAPKLEH